MSKLPKSETKKEQLKQVVPPIIVQPDKEDMALTCISCLIDLAQESPKLFKPVLDNLVAFMTQQMKNEALEDGTRQNCLEIMITLTEAAPGMMRKHAAFGHNVIPVLLDWMAELDDDQSWYSSENLDDDDNDSNETVGEQSMDRLAIYLGPAIVLPEAFTLIPKFVSSPEWQKRHAALRCISAIGEGCHKQMRDEISKVIDVVLPHLQDPHPRVRHAACNAIGQMCTDFAPHIQNKFHARILPALISVLDDSSFLRVQTYGAAAMVNFSESAKKEAVAPYLPVIIPKLLALMNTGATYAQEQAITTLATVADSAGPEFAQFYGSIMPVLMNFLRMPNHKELRSLRGKTMECASLVALAVGKDVFGPHAAEFLGLLRDVQAGITDTDDPQSSYLLSAWARVCKVLGADFAPYLEIVLPPLLASAQLHPPMQQFDFDEDIPDEYSPEEGWELLDVNGKTIGIRTSMLDDKCTAIEMLVCYVQEMGPLFHTFVENIMQMLLPLLSFAFHEGVRYAAASVVPLLIKSWILAQYPGEKIEMLWFVASKSVLECLKTEDDIGMVGQLYTTFLECIELMGNDFHGVTSELLTLFTQTSQHQLQTYFERIAEREGM
jgi:importin-5